jgi:hypothetical protein
MNLDAEGFDFSVKQALKFLEWKNPKTVNGKKPKTAK